MNPKLKAESYSQLGGINTKISSYLNSPLEFLDIKNFDFQKTGALSQRWGSTQYVTQSFTGPITTLFEFSKLDGSSYVVIGHTGGIWAGATTGMSQGYSLIGNGNTRFLYAYPNIAKAPGSGNGSNDSAAFNFNFYYKGDSGSSVYWPAKVGGYSSTLNLSFFTTSRQASSAYSFDNGVLNNTCFMADGSKYLRFSGSTFYYGGLPPPTISSTFGVNILQTLGKTTITGTIPNYGLGASYPGVYSFFAQYVNDRGYLSDIWPVAYYEMFGAGGSPLSAMSATLDPNYYFRATVEMNVPSGYGITAVNIYSFYCATFIKDQSAINRWAPPYVFRGTQPVAPNQVGELSTIFLGGELDSLQEVALNAGPVPDLKFNTYLNSVSGITFIGASNIGVAINPTMAILSENFPKYLEVYKNRMFAAGYSGALSKVAYSDLSEPEGFPVTNNFEVRTNDGDYVTALKAYATRLYIFKKGSFFALLGDNPNNFSLQEISLTYGCLNNNCTAVYEQILLFLDRKGVVMYNGANIDVISTKIQPIFERMNYSVAVNTAVMVHDKLRNQVLCSIPVDGSSVNNLTVVYDYFTQAWTTYDGFIPTLFAEIQGRNNSKNVFYGPSTGLVNWFGQSFLSDNGTGFTTYYKTRFLHDMGESIQKQFRRLYINADTGTTFIMPINFYQDYGSSVVYSTTFVLSQFQNRIDYGIPAKSLAYELANIQQNSPLRIYGFTIESRLQRKV